MDSTSKMVIYSRIVSCGTASSTMLGGDFVILLESVLTPWFSTRMEAWPCAEMLEQEFKIHNAGEGLLEAILEEWRSEQAVPLFVSEGTMQQKVSSIQNSYYLSTVYREVLTSQRPSLTILGWGLENMTVIF